MPSIREKHRSHAQRQTLAAFLSFDPVAITAATLLNLPFDEGASSGTPPAVKNTTDPTTFDLPAAGVYAMSLVLFGEVAGAAAAETMRLGVSDNGNLRDFREFTGNGTFQMSSSAVGVFGAGAQLLQLTVTPLLLTGTSTLSLSLAYYQVVRLA